MDSPDSKIFLSALTTLIERATHYDSPHEEEEHARKRDEIRERFYRPLQHDNTQFTQETNRLENEKIIKLITDKQEIFKEIIGQQHKVERFLSEKVRLLESFTSDEDIVGTSNNNASLIAEKRRILRKIISEINDEINDLKDIFYRITIFKDIYDEISPKKRASRGGKRKTYSKRKIKKSKGRTRK